MTITTDTPPARVTRTSTTAPTGQFDGTWWPRSRDCDFPTEAPPLLTALQRLGHFTRATLDLALWPAIPRPFHVAELGQVMRWGDFAWGEDPHRIVLYSIESREELLVAPPQTDPAAAALLLAAACGPNETRRATRLIHAITGCRTSDTPTGKSR
ncbi:DUF5994 family protein [Streptomyces sp. NPDC007172]|uniref:DUF5994 family protein n=1 Tax=Streptomyces sp. NPDC007172 TaxID=3364776 RepID=UPI0036CBB5D7